ncbi:MAG: DUF2079 domain-containing protein [Nitrospinota bacterium]
MNALRAKIGRLADRLPLRPVANALFGLIAFLWLTGGYVYRGQLGGRRVHVEAAQLDAWVVAFLIVLAVWRGCGKPLRELGCIRVLTALWVWTVRKGPPFLYAFIAGSGLLLAGVSLLRHLSFHTGYDLSIFSQAYWNTVHGDFLFSSIKGGMVLWGDHINPIVLGLLPLYWIWPSPEVLLIVQGFALAAGALPLYFLAQRELADRRVEVLIPIAYLLYLPLRSMNRADFHPIALSTPLILAAFYSLRKDRYVWFLVFAGLTGMTKETGPIAVGLLGLYCFFANRRYLLGAGIVLASGLWFFLNLSVFIPAFNPQGASGYLSRYDYLGEGLGEALLTLVTRPGYALANNLTGKEMMYPVRILAPVALLPLLTPAGLLTLPYLLINLLEKDTLQVSFFHYHAELTAFVFIAAVYGAKRVLRWKGTLPAFGGTHSPRRVKALAGVLMAGVFLFFGRSDTLHLRRSWPGEQARDVREALARVPALARVGAQAAIAPHLANRKWLYTFPEIGSANYVILDPRLDPWPIKKKNFEDEVQKVEAKGFKLVFQRNGVRLYRRPSPSD